MTTDVAVNKTTVSRARADRARADILRYADELLQLTDPEALELAAAALLDAVLPLRRDGRHPGPGHHSEASLEEAMP